MLDINYELRWETAGIPVKHRGERLTEWRIHSKATEDAWAMADHFIRTWPERYAKTTTRADRSIIGQGLAITGSHGTGKSTLACMVATELHLRYDTRILYYRAQGLMDDEFAYNNKTIAPRDLKRYKRLRTVHGLLVDDLGKEYRKPGSTFVGATVTRVTRERHELAFPSIVTSNERVEKWGQMYEPAMSSFAFEAFHIINLPGKDMRRGG